MPECRTNPPTCTKCCNVCRLPTGPTVDASADMMASVIAARTSSLVKPGLLVCASRGCMRTTVRPGFNNIYLCKNVSAWTKKTYCCTA